MELSALASRGESLQIASGGATDLGMVRTNNEDSYQMVPALQLFVLADGMGGEAHGEVASSLAVETVVKHCLEGQENPSAPLAGEAKPGLSDKSRRLASAVHLANQKVFASAAAHGVPHGAENDVAYAPVTKAMEGGGQNGPGYRDWFEYRGGQRR